MGGVTVDLYRLFFAVFDCNGVSNMSADKWREVAASLHLPTDDNSIKELGKLYDTLLVPYESHYKAKLKERKQVLLFLFVRGAHMLGSCPLYV